MMTNFVFDDLYVDKIHAVYVAQYLYFVFWMHKKTAVKNKKYKKKNTDAYTMCGNTLLPVTHK